MARPRASLPDALRAAADNRDLVRFVEARELSALTEVADVLQQAVASLRHAEVFCPDWRSNAYVVAYRNDCRVFGAAFGKHAVSCRIAPADMSAALADGGTSEATIGPDWVSFSALEPALVNKWIRLAHDA